MLSDSLTEAAAGRTVEAPASAALRSRSLRLAAIPPITFDLGRVDAGPGEMSLSVDLWTSLEQSRKVKRHPLPVLKAIMVAEVADVR
jgi:hypothetical protein